MKNSKAMRGVKPLLLMQLALCLALPTALLFIFDEKMALSALFGCLTAFVPSLVFAKTVFKNQGARAARQIIKGFYLGESLKLLLTMLFFTGVFALYTHIVPLAFFLTYITMLMTHWFSPMIIGYKHYKPEK